VIKERKCAPIATRPLVYLLLWNKSTVPKHLLANVTISSWNIRLLVQFKASIIVGSLLIWSFQLLICHQDHGMVLDWLPILRACSQIAICPFCEWSFNGWKILVLCILISRFLLGGNVCFNLKYRTWLLLPSGDLLTSICFWESGLYVSIISSGGS